VAFCARLGWTLTDLLEQPNWFVERMAVYLRELDEKMEREKERQEQDLREKLGRMRL
jgi:hypothetical protein